MVWEPPPPHLRGYYATVIDATVSSGNPQIFLQYGLGSEEIVVGTQLGGENGGDDVSCAALQPGDVLLAINGMSVTHRDLLEVSVVVELE